MAYRPGAHQYNKRLRELAWSAHPWAQTTIVLGAFFVFGAIPMVIGELADSAILVGIGLFAGIIALVIGAPLALFYHGVSMGERVLERLEGSTEHLPYRIFGLAEYAGLNVPSLHVRVWFQESRPTLAELRGVIAAIDDRTRVKCLDEPSREPSRGFDYSRVERSRDLPKKEQAVIVEIKPVGNVNTLDPREWRRYSRWFLPWYQQLPAVLNDLHATHPIGAITLEI